MPQLGESVVEGTIGRWLKQEGDTIKEMEPLLEVETDKVNTEISAPASGTVLKILVEEGTVVTVGTALAMIGEPGESVEGGPGRPVIQAAPIIQIPTPSTPAPAAAPTAVAAGRPSSGNGGPRVSPLVANIAAQHGIDVSAIPGTGMGGRVTKQDILSYIEQGGAASTPAPAAPKSIPSAPPDHVHKAPPAPGVPGQLIPHSKMRKLIAEHMVTSKLKTAPHVTTVFEADFSAVVAHREANKADFARSGVNLTFTAYFVAAVAQALRAHPMVNSKWQDDGVYLYPEVNIGMAAAIDEGLIVPVIKRADELSLLGLSREINDLAGRARKNQLKPDEVAGGTFTITNHGVSGSLFATPIINQPQTGIFGVGAIQKKVVVLEGDLIAIRPMIYLTLTFDHRVLDGASADFFMADVKKILENWQ
jgi:2-oxoglutarate dehydrogenase E2 component (dihydrolipoamide succinyltransferase)